MNKLYSVHDHWTDINKKNDVDIESIDGVIAGIKVNGEDYGGSGGGVSDFSTANVTFICNTSEVTTVEIANVQEAKPPFEPNSKSEGYVVLENGHEVTIKAVLYKGMCDCFAHNVNMSGSGNVVIDFDNATITGDCTITISNIS